MKRDKRYFYAGLTIVLSAGVCFILAGIIFNIQTCLHFLSILAGVLQPIIYGVVIAYLLNPLTHIVDDRMLPLLRRKTSWTEKVIGRVSRVAGIVVAFLILAFVGFLLVQMVLPQLTASIRTVTENLSTYYVNAETWLREILKNNLELKGYVDQFVGDIYAELTTWLKEVLPTQAQTVVTTAISSSVVFLRTLFNLIVGLIVSIYILLERDLFLAQSKKLTVALFPAAAAERLMDVARRAHHVFGGFITGKIVDSLIIGVLCYFGVLLLGLPFPVLLATIVGVTNVIPFFGPYLGAIPCAVLLLLINPLQCLYFLIFILILQQLDGNVIGPRILGDATGVSAFWVVVSITFFGGLFGLVGMVIGVPVFAILYMLVGDWARSALRKKHYPTQTKDYFGVRHVGDLRTEQMADSAQDSDNLPEK